MLPSQADEGRAIAEYHAIGALLFDGTPEGFDQAGLQEADFTTPLWQEVFRAITAQREGHQLATVPSTVDIVASSTENCFGEQEWFSLLVDTVEKTPGPRAASHLRGMR